MSNHNIINFANDYGEVIVPCRKISNVILSAVAIVVGVWLFFLPSLVVVESQFLMMLCIITGVFLVASGFVISIFMSTELVYSPTDSPISVRYRYLSPQKIHKVEMVLRNANIDISNPMQLEGNGQLRIDNLVSADGKLCLCMVFQYVPYNYKPLYGPYTLSVMDASKLMMV